MKNLIYLIPFLISLQNSFSQVNYDSIQSFVQNKISDFPNEFYISIAVIKNEKTHFIGLKKEDSIVHIELRDSLFEIGSVTKVFTSTLLAKNVIDEKIKLESPINKVFPYKFNNKIKLTYLSLANHTAGLYRLPSNIFPQLLKTPETPYKNYSFEYLDEYLKKELQLESEKSSYSYSNLGAGILAYSLALKEKTKYEILLKDNIFSKYQMYSTGFDANTFVKGIDENGNSLENWNFNSLSGAGGLISNTNDLSKFVLAQFDEKNEELALTRKSTHTISENMEIGLGWHIINPKYPDPIYWHNGGTGGFTSSVALRFNSKTGVIILSNISPNSKIAGKIDEMCFEILDMIK